MTNRVTWSWENTSTAVNLFFDLIDRIIEALDISGIIVLFSKAKMRTQDLMASLLLRGNLILSQYSLFNFKHGLSNLGQVLLWGDPFFPNRTVMRRCQLSRANWGVQFPILHMILLTFTPFTLVAERVRWLLHRNIADIAGKILTIDRLRGFFEHSSAIKYSLKLVGVILILF